MESGIHSSALILRDKDWFAMAIFVDIEDLPAIASTHLNPDPSLDRLIVNSWNRAMPDEREAAQTCILRDCLKRGSNARQESSRRPTRNRIFIDMGSF
jgi:hypothetical protein